MRHLWIICCATVLFSTAASAQMIGDAQCKDQKFTDLKVENIHTTIKRVIDAVEEVPPEEANYIHSEKKHALDQANEVRFNAVASRRYATALQFHDDAKVVVENLRAAKRASGRDLARYLVVVLARMGDLQVSMEDYISSDARRNPHMLSKDSRSAMFYDMPTAKGQTVNLLQCVISVL